MSAVLDQWELTNSEFGGDLDFTAIVKMIERRAGVIVGKAEEAMSDDIHEVYRRPLRQPRAQALARTTSSATRTTR